MAERKNKEKPIGRNLHPGRPPHKLTLEAKARFIRAITFGSPLIDACGCAGFTLDWFNKKRAKAQADPETPDNAEFLEFIYEISKAEGEATTRWLEIIEKSAQNGTWQAAAWKLERRRGMIPKSQCEITGLDGGPLKHEIGDLRDKLVDKLASLATKRQKGGTAK